METTREYEVILSLEAEGGYSVFVPDLPSVATQGETREEALSMAKKAIEGYLEETVRPSPDEALERHSRAPKSGSLDSLVAPTLVSMFERFTERARQVVVLAQEEARILKHNYIGTEHILLGLVRENNGVAARILLDVGADAETVRNEVIHTLAGGPSAGPGPSLGRIGLSDALLDGAGAPLRNLVDQLESRLGRPADAGDLLLLLASVPEGISQRALTALVIDLDALAQAIEQARLGSGRSALLPPPDVLAQCEQVRAERLAAIKAQDYPQAAELRERERELLASALEPVEQRQETFLANLWGG